MRNGNGPFTWTTSRTITVTQEGKHVIRFPEGFPLVVKAMDFTVDYRISPNYHDYLEIAYVFKGEGVLKIGINSWNITEGDLLVIGNTEMHTFLTNYANPLSMITVYFLPELIYFPGDMPLNFEYIRIFYDHTHNFSNLIHRERIAPTDIPDRIRRLYSLADSENNIDRLAAKNCLCSILLQLLSMHQTGVPFSTERYNKRTRDINRLKEVFSYVQSNYDKEITLAEAAEIACMSTHYFCRFFKRVTAHTFIEYLQHIRIDVAKQLLLQDKLSNTQIAYEVGFNNPCYFYRLFKKYTHVNPSEFIRTFQDQHRTSLEKHSFK